MDEAFLHHVWMFKRFNHHNLILGNGKLLSILNYGNYNRNSGPDFLNATLKIDHTIWHGHIEIHIRSKDWTAHKHNKDPAYNNVILHVVYEDNGPVTTESGIKPVCLELKGRIDMCLVSNYKGLFDRHLNIPCKNFISTIDHTYINIYLERLLTERLQSKTRHILRVLKNVAGDWEQCLYVLILAYIGGPVNKVAFEELANRVPYKLISKYLDKALSAEALLFGQSGMLRRFEEDTYMKALKKEYAHLKRKHRLLAMTGNEWRFGTLRPQNSPALRIAQIAAIYLKNKALLSTILNAKTTKDLIAILDIETSRYWNRHFIPGKASSKKVKPFGMQTKTAIVINAFIPLLFARGILLNDEYLRILSIEFLAELKAEDNHIIKMWTRLGIHVDNCSQTQALIELKTQYCDKFKCLNCRLGTKLLLNAE